MRSLADSVSTFNRNRKWRLFTRHHELTPALRVLDVGFSEQEFQEADNYMEKHYPYPAQLTALGIHEASAFRARYPEVSTVTYDGFAFPFPDKCFDILWSNAVLEHVGDRSRQRYFLSECNRVAKRVFLTTPNRYFPIEVHTRTLLLHYLPRRWFEAYLRAVGKAWATGNYMHLLSRRDLRKLLAAVGVSDYVIHGNWLLVAPVDFVVMFETV